MKNWKNHLATALAQELAAVGFRKAKDARFLSGDIEERACGRGATVVKEHGN